MYRKKFGLKLFSSTLAIACVASTTFSLISENNNLPSSSVANADSSLASNSQAINKINSSTDLLSNNYIGTNWKLTTVDNESRVVVSAINDTQLSLQYPYSATNEQLGELFRKSYNSLFVGNFKQPNATDFVISDVFANNKEGWLDVYATCKGFYDENNNWVADGYLPYVTIRVIDFKQAKPTPSIISQKVTNGYYVTYRDYAYNLYTTLKKTNNLSQLASTLSDIVREFGQENFPDVNFEFLSTENSISNDLGILNVVLNLDGYFQDDQYCTFSNMPITISGNIQCEYQGISSFSNNVIDFLETGAQTFGPLTSLEFIEKLASNDSQLVKWAQNEVFKLITNPYANKDSSTISFSTNVDDYKIYSDTGIIVLAGNMNSLFVENNVISDNFAFNNNNYPIYVTGFKKVITTEVVKQVNFPIVDFSSGDDSFYPLYKPSIVKQKLLQSKNISWSNADNFAKKFLLVLNQPENLDNLMIKEIEVEANDDTGELTITKLIFSGALIHGEIGDLVVCSPDLDPSKQIEYVFPLAIEHNTTISSQLYLPVELTRNLFPYQFDYYSNVDKIKSLIKEMLLSNLPNGFNDSDLLIELSSEPFDNKKGQVIIDVYLKKYIKENNFIDKSSSTNKNDWLKQTVNMLGFKFTNSTYFTRKFNYPKDMVPYELDEYLAGKSDYEKFDLFFDAFNVPNPNELQNNISNFTYEIDNLKGIVDVSFTLNNGYFKDDAISKFTIGKLNYTESFNLFNTIEETTINQPIFIEGVESFIVSDFLNSIFVDSSKQNYNILKKSIFDNTISAPINIDASNFYDWVVVDNLKEVDNINKTFKATIYLLEYYDSDGTYVKAESLDNAKVFTDVLFKGNFRSVENTLFDNGKRVNVANTYPEVANINASSWKEADIRDFIVKKWKDEKMVVGDTPPELVMSNDLIIKEYQPQELSGEIYVSVSLKTFYFNQKLYQNVSEGYNYETIIILTGFSSEEDTEIPVTINDPLNLSIDDYASNFYNNKTKDEWKQFILTNVLLGSKKDLTINDIEGFQINRVDDKLGMISIDFNVTKYWKDFAIQENQKPLEARNLWISGFNTRVPSSFSKSTKIDLGQSQVLASKFFSDPSHDTTYWKNLFVLNNIISESNLPVSDSVTIFDCFDYDNTKVQINNSKGEIVFKDVSFTKYFGETYALKRNHLGNYDPSISAKYQNDLSNLNYSYPTSVTNRPTNVVNTPPKTDITITGFKVIGDPTSFIDSDTIAYDPYSFLIQNGYSTSYILSIINDPSSAEYDRFVNDIRDFIYKNCVTGAKLDMNSNDLVISGVSADWKNGTITILAKLNKYWDANGEFVDCTTDPTKQPLQKDYILSGFIPSIDTIVSKDNSINAINIGNFVNITPSELKSKLESVNDQLNSLYSSQIKQAIISNSISGNKNSPVNVEDNIQLVSYVADDIQGTLTVTYNVKQVWSGGLLSAYNDNPCTFVITNLKKEKETSVASPINLNEWYFDDLRTTRFNVSNIYASDFYANGYDGISFNESFIKLITNNRTELVVNGVDTSDLDITDISATANENDIDVTFSMMARYLDKSTNSFKIGKTNFTVKLIGFKKIITGPTSLNRDTKILIGDPLLAWVNDNKISAYNFYEIISNPSHSDYNMVYSWLQEIIFNQCVDQNSNLGQGKENKVTAKDIVILTKTIDGSTPNIFDGTCPISFYLSSYYDTNGQYVESSTQQDASRNYLLKTITLTPFYKIVNNNGATIPANEGTVIPISSVKTGKNENGFIEDDILTTISASSVLRNEYNDYFKAWIMQNLYSGNLDGILFNSLEDANNVELVPPSASDINDEEGYIIISARLKTFWTKDGYGQNGCPIVKIKVTNFKRVVSTKFNDVTHDLTINTPSEPQYSEIISEIQNSKPKEFISKLESGDVNVNTFIDYLKQWIVKNKDQVFSDLPPMTDEELLSYLYIDVDENNFPLIQSDKAGQVKITIGLKKYFNQNGQIATFPESQPLIKQISFSGFSMVGEPTKLAPESLVSVEELSTNQPWFIAKDRDGNYYSTITVDSIVKNGNFIDNNEKNVIKRIILNKPDKADGEMSNNYKILDGKLSLNVGTPENIIIDRVVSYSTLGRIDVFFNLAVAWTAEDDNIPTAKNLAGKLTLVGFKTIDPVVQASEKITPFIIGAIAGGVSIFILLIVGLVFYKKRRDIEYQQ